MWNDSMINTIFVYIGLIVLELIVVKIVEPYIPERKKLISYIKKFFFLPTRYIFPITFIILLMTKAEVVDKWFVFILASSFTVLLGNLFIDLFSKYTEHLIETEKDILEMRKQNLEVHQNQLEARRQTVETMKKMVELIDRKKSKKSKK
jgi:hypothetical protein